MRLRRFMAGSLAGLALLLAAGAGAPRAWAAAGDLRCFEGGNFICCCTEVDCRCMEKEPLQPVIST
jgi:hypothetical protein